MIDPVEGPEAANEWVELYNPTSQAVDLAGWALADNISTKALPQVDLGPRSYMVVAAKVEAFLAAHPGFTGLVVGSPGDRIGNGLSNQADMALLKGPSGQVADLVNWGRPNASWPNYRSSLWDPGLSPPAPDRSLGRMEGQSASQSLGAWASFSRPSPGQVNPAQEPSPTPSPAATYTSLPSFTATPSATRTLTPTPAARPTSTPTAAAARVGTPPSGLILEASPSPALLEPPALAVSSDSPSGGTMVAVAPSAAPTPGQTRVPPATAAPTLPPSSLPLGKALPRGQDQPTTATEGNIVQEAPPKAGAAGGPDFLVLFLMALPLLGLAFWLKERLLP